MLFISGICCRFHGCSRTGNPVGRSPFFPPLLFCPPPPSFRCKVPLLLESFLESEVLIQLNFFSRYSTQEAP